MTVLNPLLRAFFAVGLGLCGGLALAVTPGTSAPGVSLKTIDDTPFSLSDFKGRWVVLEWVNPDCPFVQKHYNAGNMQATQRFAATQKVLWVQINSTTPTHKDYKSAAQMRDWLVTMKSQPDYSALDEPGVVGRAYAAKTTPQMVLVDPAGMIVYNGAIDDKRSANVADIPGARNHLKAAIEEVMAGKPVSQPATTPYGCTIKY